MEAAPYDRRQKRHMGLYVTRNWRITFRIDADEKEICDVNFEDYH